MIPYLRKLLLLWALTIVLITFIAPIKLMAQNKTTDSIPSVVSDWGNILTNRLESEAAAAFIKSPKATDDNWAVLRDSLRAAVIEKSAVKFYTDLPFNAVVNKTTKLENYRVENIYFQTRPDVYATANLYIPDGEGPFPAVLVMMGHSRNGKLYESYQSIGHTLALNGYVALCIDPWGAGERGTEPGEFEYHGSNLGASLMSIGETLMGMQITDNIRAVDFLQSLSLVNPSKIGATGASGGGNQTMWLAAVDERIKAAAPIVSVGTFKSYVVNSNCVCELLVDGLCVTEEFNILGLVAPRALLVANGLKDSNPAFYPSEMLKSYKEAEDIYEMIGSKDKLTHYIADVTHGYHPVFREAMLGWFDLHLMGVGKGKPKKEQPFNLLPEKVLLVFDNKQRHTKITSTVEFILKQGLELKSSLLSKSIINSESKKEELLKNLRIDTFDELKEVHKYATKQGWERVVLETKNGSLIPVSYKKPVTANAYTVVFRSEGKSQFNFQKDSEDEGRGIILVDLWALGERGSQKATKIDGGLPKFHTLSRSKLWLGETIMGEWVNEMNLIINFIHDDLNSPDIHIIADKETGMAALITSVINKNHQRVSLQNTPISYLPNSGITDYYNMAIHVPNILQWGDISLLVALSKKTIQFETPRSISGTQASNSDWQSFEKEVRQFEKLSTREGTTNLLLKL